MSFGQENQGSFRGQGRGEVVGGADTESEGTTEAWLLLDGSVQTVSDDDLTLILSDGETLVIEGRSWRYAGERGFTTLEGDRLAILGFYEDGEFKVAEIEIHVAEGFIKPWVGWV